MWKRRTFHDCAHELLQISDRFRLAANGEFGINSTGVMTETSVRGVEILRILSLSVRSEQDYGLTDGRKLDVGILVSDPDAIEITEAIRDRRVTVPNKPLTLRDGLNKIAHADPTRSTYRLDPTDHVLVLISDRGERWIVELSIPKLCSAILQLKDRAIKMST